MANNQLQFGNKVVFISGLPLTLPIAASDPVSAVAGDMYYSSSTNSVRVYNGTSWAPVAAYLTGLPLAANNILIGDDASNLSDAIDTSSLGHILADSFTALTIKSGVIVDSMVASGAAIEYSKLNLAGSIVNNDINSSAAIAYSKLNLSGSIINSDISPTAGIVYTKLTLTNSIVNSDINTAAAIDFSKFAALPSAEILVGNGSNVAAAVPVSGDLTLANTGAFSIFSIQGNAVSGTTGTGNVVFSASPTVTGTFTAAALTATSASLSGALNMNSNQINNLGMAGSPAGTDATNVTYVQAQIANAINGLTWKGPVKAYSNVNVPLTGGATLTIDGYAVQNGDYVILANQTTASQNNVYVASGIGTAYSLALAPAAELSAAVGDAYLIESGTQYGNSSVQVNSITPNVTYIQFTGPNFFVFNQPLMLSGNTVSLNYGNGLTINTGNLIVNLAATSALAFSSSALAVQTDASTIGINGSNQLYVLSGGITNTQVSATAAIARSKLASGTDYAWVTNGATGVMQDTSVTANSAVATDANGLPVASSTTATELGFVHGVTSSIQTQLNGKANTALSNLAAVAINTSLLPASDIAINLGAAALRWLNLYVTNVISQNSNLSINAGSGNLLLQTAAMQRSTDGTNYLIETYTDATSLTDNQSSPQTAFQFNYSSIAGYEITYIIESGDANKDCRLGTLRVTSNNSGTITPAYTDMFAETADCGVQWSAVLSGSNILIQYTTTNQGAARTMRSDIKSFRR